MVVPRFSLIHKTHLIPQLRSKTQDVEYIMSGKSKRKKNQKKTALWARIEKNTE